ncbi:MAG: hypothetical protein EPO24_09550 [Bacteroidetes bacterium]|nr:MAG: hypothetical protein EPO24_09550 [Bacteroidota bacterium]
MKQSYIIGIDGGGTKTVAAIARLDATIVAQVKAGPSNPNAVGFEQSAKVLLNLVDECCQKVGCKSNSVKKIVIGLAGAGREEDKQQLLKILKNLGGDSFVKKVILETDVRIAFEAAFPDNEAGIAVISGTGSIVMARTANQKFIRAGGWGKTLGDDGSGHAIARDAIREVLKSHEGRMVKTVLTSRLKKSFKLRSVDEIISYAAHHPIASFAPQVIEEATKGDTVAKEILMVHALALAEAVEIVRIKMQQKENIQVVCFGSLLEHRNFYSALVREIIHEMIPGVVIRKQKLSPVYGALLLARKSIN